MRSNGRQSTKTAQTRFHNGELAARKVEWLRTAMEAAGSVLDKRAEVLECSSMVCVCRFLDTGFSKSRYLPYDDGGYVHNP
jgi:hypothetical protein